MTYITGATYPSGDASHKSARRETLNAYQRPNTAIALGYANRHPTDYALQN